MSKLFNEKISFNASPIRVLDMLQDASYLNCKRSEAIKNTYKVTAVDGSLTIQQDCIYELPDEVPGFLKSLLGGELPVGEVQVWNTAPDNAGSFAGTYELKVSGKPAHATALLQLSPTSTGSLLTYNGQVTVDVPLLGGQIESYIADLASGALREEEAIANEWLRKHPEG